MKLIYSALALTLLLVPFSTHAAWYWLNNPVNSDLGDFVELSALGYAETTASKELLIPIEDELKELLDDAKHFDKCEDKYDSVINALKGASSSYQISPTFEQSIEKCITEEETQENLEEALNDCDLEYLDEELSSSQKVTYNKQIALCKEQVQEKSEAEVVTTPTGVQTQPSVPQQVNPAIVQAAPFPVQTSPVSALEEENIIMEDTEVEDTSDKESGNRSQQKNEAVTVPDQDEVSTALPSFLNRIISFFTNLFSW